MPKLAGAEDKTKAKLACEIIYKRRATLKGKQSSKTLPRTPGTPLPGYSLTHFSLLHCLNGLETEVTRLRTENDWKDAEIDDLKRWLDKDQPMMEGQEEGSSLMMTLKAFFDQKESKVRVPEPHDWEGDWQGLSTFKRECETWIADRKITRYEDVPKAITMIAGWMKGPAAQWYTMS